MTKKKFGQVIYKREKGSNEGKKKRPTVVFVKDRRQNLQLLLRFWKKAKEGFRFQCLCSKGCATHGDIVVAWWKVLELTIRTLETQSSHPAA